MRIVADENIVFVKEAFSTLGEVSTYRSSEITTSICKDADILLVRAVTKVDAELLQNSSIKFVGSVTSGTDHIDTQFLMDQSIGFASALGSNANAVAEWVVAALCWCELNGVISFKNSVLGIIGAGNVGSKVFQKAEALGLQCILNDPPKQRITNNMLYRPLQEVLLNASIISLHVPLTFEGPDKTHHLINEDIMNLVKPGTLLINSSRGKVLNEKDLLSYHGKGFGSIVLDVWTKEPHISIELLDRADIATPHIAGHSFDGKVAALTSVYQAACAFFYKECLWDSDHVFSGMTPQKIQIEQSNNPLRDAILQSYPIQEDDGLLRKIKECEPSQRPEYFEQIRTGYRKRLEFSHSEVNAASLDQKLQNNLSTLGFTVVR